MYSNNVKHTPMVKFIVPFKLTLFLLACTVASCVNTRKAIYLDNVAQTELTQLVDDLEPVIQKNDILSITVSSPNPTATQIFNISNTTSTQLLGYVTTQASGYLVDQQGYIDFPLLGKLKSEGLTKKQLKENIAKALVQNQYLIDPVVNIRYLNYKVTVLGEVAKPGVINVPDEKITLFEALGMAGDMTIYAKRNNVMLIRDEQGKRVLRRLNLNSGELLTSPYYYLKSNDIVYVEPNTSKISGASNARTWLPVVLSGLSLGVLIIDRLTR